MSALTATAPPPGQVSIRILHVADCPHLSQLRRAVEVGLARLGLTATIEEVEGPYPSPTLLVDGLDVTGRALAIGASCRLDLPTARQVEQALVRWAPRTAVC